MRLARLPMPSLLSIVFFLIHLTTSAQAPIEWVKRYGGSGEDEAWSVKQTSDGGYIIAGDSSSSDGDVGGNQGNRDIWLVKLNKTGALEWQKTFGGSSSDGISVVTQTKDGGYILGAFTYSDDGDVNVNKGQLDYWILKVDRRGQLEWQKTYGGSGLEKCSSIIEASDGGYIIVGIGDNSDGDISSNNGNRDIWLLKIDLVGNIVWDKSYGGRCYDSAANILKTEDGGYILLGEYAFDCWIIKLDKYGNILWDKKYGGPGREFTQSIQPTADGGYVIVSLVNERCGETSKYWILKIDAKGNKEWVQTYGGSEHDVPGAIQQTADNGYLIGGYTESNDGDIGKHIGHFDYWIVKLDTNGKLVWEKTYGGKKSDSCRDLILTKDGGYMAVGGSERDFWIIKFSSDGDDTKAIEETEAYTETEESEEQDNVLTKEEEAYTITEENEEQLVPRESIDVNYDDRYENPKLLISPNPSRGRIFISSKVLKEPVSLEIVDLSGRSIFSKDQITLPIEINNLPQGYHTAIIRFKKWVYTEKIIAVR